MLWLELEPPEPRQRQDWMEQELEGRHWMELELLEEKDLEPEHMNMHC